MCFETVIKGVSPIKMGLKVPLHSTCWTEYYINNIVLMKHSRCENAAGLKAHLWTPKAGPGETIAGQND